jgi:HD-like signal output (HDOD) protein
VKEVQDTIESLLGELSPTAQKRLTRIASRLYGPDPAGPMETARLLESLPTLASRLIRVANKVHHGAGISATNLQAAVIRLGTDRTKSLILAHEIAELVGQATQRVSDTEIFWQTSLTRGSLARAVAIKRNSRVAAMAFLVGFLQDLGVLLIAARQPREYRSLMERSEGCSLRLAILEWQSLNFNHIHVVIALLARLGLPSLLIEAIGRHHTNPPVGMAGAPALALWQIGYLVGAISMTPDSSSAPRATLARRLVSSAFQATGPGIAALVRSAQSEFEDLVDLFAEKLPIQSPTANVFGDVGEMLGTPSVIACDESDASVVRNTSERLAMPLAFAAGKFE